MARKLKSDRMLFLATILLVGLSIVMVYSASAVVAQERYQQPYLFLTKQAMWALLGMALLGIVMRIDYRLYREPVFIWSCLGRGDARRSSPCSSARRSTTRGAGSRSAGSASSRRSWPSSARSSSSPRCSSGACTASTRSATRSRRSPIVVGGLVGLILLEPDFGTAVTIVLIAAVMVFAAGLSYRYIGGAAAGAGPARHRHRRRGAVPSHAAAGVPRIPGTTRWTPAFRSSSR